jgi:hypothetical protein
MLFYQSHCVCVSCEQYLCFLPFTALLFLILLRFIVRPPELSIIAYSTKEMLLCKLFIQIKFTE